MKISIIIPVFRAADKLPATLDSVFAQAGDVDVEAVVVDGGSNDGTDEVLRTYAARHGDRLRYLSEPDRGVYDAMNKGLALSTGDYVTFFGAGDTLDPNAIARVVPHLPLSDQPTLAYGGVVWRGRPWLRRFGRCYLGWQNVCHQSVYYGRSLVKRIGDYNLRYKMLADWEYNFRCWGDPAVTKAYLPFVVANYEGGGMSETRADVAFHADRPALIRCHLGLGPYVYYRWRLFWHPILVWAYAHLGIRRMRHAMRGR